MSEPFRAFDQHRADRTTGRIASRALDGSPPATEPPGAGSARLVGRRLVAARAAWLATLIWVLTLFVAAIPLRQAELASTFQNLSPAQELVLEELGIFGEYAGLVLLIETAVPAVFIIIGLILFWQRSDDWVAIYTSASLATYISWVNPVLDTLVTTHTEWELASRVLQVLGWACTVNFFLIFPDGRFVPRWTRLLCAASLVWALIWLLRPGSALDLSNPFQLTLLSFGLLACPSFW